MDQEQRERIAQALVNGAKRYIDQNFAALLKRLEDLESRLSDIESKGVRYRGTWQPADDYARGDMVTHAGSVWHANAATRSAPGEGSKDWTLAVKKGRDAR